MPTLTSQTAFIEFSATFKWTRLFFTKINASNFTEHVFLQSGLHVHLSWWDCPQKIPVKKKEISQFCTDFFLVKIFSVEF